MNMLQVVDRLLSWTNIYYQTSTIKACLNCLFASH
jgi:hypothetical protein